MNKRSAVAICLGLLPIWTMAAESADSQPGDVSLYVGQTLYFDLTSIERGKATTALRRFTEPPSSPHDVVMVRLVKIGDGGTTLEVQNGFAPGLYYEVRACATSSVLSCQAVGNFTSRVGLLDVRNFGANVTRVILSGFRVMRNAASTSPP